MATVTPAVLELWLSFNGTAELALSIPLAKCRDLAVNPLKWLRFLGYAIYGQEGYLSASDAGPPIDDYTADIAAHGSYYFISEHPSRLVDVDAVDDRTSDASELSDRRADFRERIVDRDGTCVSTGEQAELCIACHIIPHSKGDNYIANALSHRSAADNEDELEGIDDTRNGLLLWSALLHPFGTGALAFLKIPNFYLSVDDIPYARREENQASPTNRLTLHYIVESGLGILLPSIIPNNSDLREPGDTSQWPPAMVVDLFYASAALKAWAPKAFIQNARAMAKDAYYNDPDDDMSDGIDANPYISPESSARQRLLDARNEKKARAAHPEETQFSSVMDGVMALWMRSARQGKGNRQRITASSHAHRCDKVQAWVDSESLDFDSGVVTASR